MPKYCSMISNGMASRGHHIEVWSPKPSFFKLSAPKKMKKWLGYVDQYVLFPKEVRARLKKCSPDTLFVFTDNALGPWVPLVHDRPHVIHCHDFLAQRSALGEIKENPVQWSGQQYQAMIRRGYRKGMHFICGSYKTKDDLDRFLNKKRVHAEVVYNGLNQQYPHIDPSVARRSLGAKFNIFLDDGFLLHVGGNQWYKNRVGVLELYEAWRRKSEMQLPLLMIGAPPTTELLNKQTSSPFNKDIHFLTGVSDEFVRYAYAGATVFLFPSLAEGFGWPVAEAMASGCPVVTTKEAPMTEVAGQAGFLIPRRPYDESKVSAWAKISADVIHEAVSLTPDERSKIVKAGIENSQRFDTNKSLNQIEEVYQYILKSELRA